MNTPAMDFRSISRQYKGSLLVEIGIFCIAVVVSVLLFLKLVIPQYQNWSTLNEEAKTTREHIKTIKENIAYLNTLQDSEVEDSVVTATKALPTQKDFSGAMQAILASSIASGVQLEEFRFSVGNIATTSAGVSTDPASMEISLDVQGDGKSLKDYITTLYKYLPLSTTTTVESATSEQGGTSTISLTFPSSPLPEVPFLKTSPIPKSSPGNKAVLSTLKEWQAAQINVVDDTGSSSASLPPPF